MALRTIFAIAALLVAGAVAAQAYRWVDEDGVVHFSDRPIEGAERIVLPDSNTVSTVRRQPRSSLTEESDAEAEPPTEFAYSVLEVANPQPEETLWNIEGVLSVSLNLQPALRPEDQVRVYFNGEPRIVAGTSFQIEEVWRGVHNIQAEVVDASGKMMIRSKTNRFYVQQNTVAF